jgi:hypothetical protein
MAGKANDAESQNLMIGRITLHQKNHRDAAELSERVTCTKSGYPPAERLR